MKKLSEKQISDGLFFCRLIILILMVGLVAYCIIGGFNLISMLIGVAMLICSYYGVSVVCALETVGCLFSMVMQLINRDFEAALFCLIIGVNFFLIVYFNFQEQILEKKHEEYITEKEMAQ